MKVFYLLISIGLFSCWGDDETIPNADQHQKDIIENSEMDTLTYLALGDSYTIGESVPQSDRWPVQLVAKLNELGDTIAQPQIIAKTGWTTNELMDAIDRAEVADAYDLVSLLIGVNNQYRGYPISQQEREFEELLQKAIAFAGSDTSRVFVVSIPDWGVTPFGESRDREQIAREIDQYNDLNQLICKKYGVKYFDITPISREAADDPTLIAGDGLHPSGKMYERWVELIYPWVHEILAE